VHITALPVVVPLIAAAVLTGARRWSGRLFNDACATGVGIGVVVLCALLLVRSTHHPFAYWMGGWRPKHMVSIGISFSVDQIGAGLATFAAILVTASLIYSWRYFDSVDGLFHALMLLFLAAMAGFSLTGDLFNLVVFFELMGAVAYALTAYRIESKGPIQGAINFAISNSVAAYAMFLGVALLYARTGALNMAQIGAALDGHRADPLVIVAMVLLFAGFLTKAAAIPLHFWLADAHSVAPTPVCVLFSGVMVELGVYAIARLYWTIFAGPLGPHAVHLRMILIAFGTVTALGGAVMCFTQRHVKRLLAFSTISHVGVFLCGLGLLSGAGLAGTAVYIVGHGLDKAALFMMVGILLHRFGSLDEFDLRGRGRALPLVGVLFGTAGLVLAAFPFTTGFFGKSLLEAAAIDGHYPWLPAVFVISSMLTAGAVLRVAGRVFLGWGRADSGDGAQAQAAREEHDEETASRDRTPPSMVVVPAVLVVAAAVLGLVPGLVPGIEAAAYRFGDHAAYIGWVLRGSARFPPAPHSHIEAFDYLYASGAVVGAFAMAALGLFGPGVRATLSRGALAPLADALNGFRRLHSGHIGDYIAWWTVGAAVLGAASLLLLT
jgi:multicomponent Na+:H+ antiporter subunit D